MPVNDMIQTRDSSISSSFSDTSVATTRSIAQVHSEVEWGRAYRYKQLNAREPSLLPTYPPLDFQELWDKYQLTKRLEELKCIEAQIDMQSPPRPLKLPHNKMLIDRNTISKKKYWEYMSTPHHVYIPERKPNLEKISIKRRLRPKGCSPRLNQLAAPTKTRILYTWKDYGYILPIDAIPRLEALLHHEHDLDPKFARCYFNTLDRKKRTKRKMKMLSCKRQKRKQVKKEKQWLQCHINHTVDQIVNFFKNEPLFALNYKQMLLSEELLQSVTSSKNLKRKPIRGSKNDCDQAKIEICDQIAVWMDIITRYIDVQYTESAEDFFGEPEELYLEMEGEDDEEEDAFLHKKLLELELLKESVGKGEE